MSSREQLRAWSDEKLRGTLQFFDCDTLRPYYTGLLFELRQELERRRREQRPVAALVSQLVARKRVP